MTARIALVVSSILSMPLAVPGQVVSTRPPVIDLHRHTPARSGPIEQFAPSLEAAIASMDSLNVRFVLLTGAPDVLFAWRQGMEGRIRAMSGLLFPCPDGVVSMWGRPCFENGDEWPDLGQLRTDIEAGRVEALGEVATQFLGLGPSDPALEPYFALAEEYDLPVFIHMGPGLPGTNYGAGIGDSPVPGYRAAAGNPLLLEDALLRHPTVRVAVMHAGWPMGDEMVFMLYQHPQVYAEVGLLQTTQFFPRAEYYSYLKRLVDAGFSDRILFGSDASLPEGISAIVEAEFLSEQQKADILCNNAARFLRLGESICR